VTTTADVAVVGAGVIGSSVALALARQGRRVVVVDKLAGPGQGSTSASSAIVRFNYSTWDGVATAWESKHRWDEWADYLGATSDETLARFRRTGLVMLDAPIAPKDRVLALFDDIGVPYEVWDADELARRVPGLDVGRHWPPRRLDDDAFWADPSGRLGAFFTPDAGYVDDAQLAAVNLADAARKAGTDFRFHRTITRVVVRSGRVDGLVLSDGEQVSSPVVVNAAGPWSSALNALAGVGGDFTVAVRPMRQEVHHIDVPSSFGDDSLPVVADLDLGIYLRGSPGGGLLVGGTEPACDPLQWIDDPDDADLHVTAAGFDAQVTRAARRFPSLGVPAAPRGIAGVYDVAADWTPIYDRTDVDGFYVAMGTSGNQFKNAPVVGPMMARLIDAVEAGHDHDVDPVPFPAMRIGRVIDLGAFSRKRPVNSDSTGTVLG
jgi:glycine/D-amino acid oxidase-like deaminating enzyme